MNIKELIYSIKKRPGMFVETEKIEYIYYLISGYCGTCKHFSENEMEKEFRFLFGQWLIVWIRNNVDKDYIPSTGFWYNDLNEICIDGNVTKLFYDLCDVFFDDYDNKKRYFEKLN